MRSPSTPPPSTARRRVPLGKAVAAALLRANRALRVHAALSEGIEHATSEGVILALACRIVVDVGGYAAAWIGKAEHDERRTVRAVADAGVGMDEIPGLGIVWSDDVRGHGTTGMAIRSCTTSVFTGGRRGPALGVFAEFAARHELCAAIGVPLVINGEIFGALTIYAREPDAFEEGESGPLADFARSLGQALERLGTTAALRESEQRFQGIFEATHVAFVVLDPDGTVRSMNDTTVRFLGFKAEEVVGRPIWEGLPLSTNRAWFRATVAQVARYKTPVREEREAVYADGRPAVFDVSVRALVDAAGETSALLVEAIDVTARRQVEVELERRVVERTASLLEANRALARANQVKDAFLAAVSHELRTPLSAVIGFAEALQQGVYGGVTASQRGAIAQVEKSGQHLLRMINDILDLTRIDSGQLDLSLAPLAVVDVCQASLRAVQSAATRKRITTSISIEPSAAQVVGDAHRLVQVLVNLLDNAVKFTPEGGEIEISARDEPGREAVRFAVRDTGIGIAPAERARLFQPFVQLDATLARRYEGTGRGLALAHKLVAMHKGEIVVESEPGVGSRFSVIVPARRGAASGAHRERDTIAGHSAPPSGSALPPRLVAELRQAANIADYDRLLGLLEEIPRDRWQLAARVRERVEEFDYAAINLVLEAG